MSKRKRRAAPVNDQFAKPVPVGYMQKAREVRPALLQDQQYLFEYGQILYHSGQTERAQPYVQASLRYRRNIETTAQARDLLEAMEVTTDKEAACRE